MHLKSVKEVHPEQEVEALQKSLFSASLYIADEEATPPLEPFVLNHQHLLFIDMEGLADRAYYQLLDGSGVMVKQGVLSGTGINKIEHEQASGAYIIRLKWAGSQLSKRLFL